MLFAEILLPVPIPKTFEYQASQDIASELEIGKRVLVEFGKRKIYTGIIYQISEEPPASYEAKHILEILDDVPTVLPIQLKLWEWIAQYYMCHLGEVMNLAIPAGLKLSSLSVIQIRPEIEIDEIIENFTDQEVRLLRFIETEGTIAYDQAAEFLQLKNAYHIIKSLIAKEAIIIFEAIKDRYKPKMQKRVRLASPYDQLGTELDELFALLSKKAKQEELLLNYLTLSGVLQDVDKNRAGVSKKNLFDKSPVELSPSAYRTLVKNGILDEFEVVISRFDAEMEKVNVQKDPKKQLSDLQKKALTEILQEFESKDAVLFHGVTGSGKTEVYIDLIERVMQGEQQVLFMLPEIAITTQMVVRLKKVFGENLGVYHSKFSDNERVEVWEGVKSGKYQVVLGVRSSIFLPFNDLGMIIVDEEHESSYKQFEPAPRYNARDIALVLAKLHFAKVVMGSATPSIETYYLALNKKFGLVSLTERFSNTPLPKVEMVDLKIERKKKTLREDFTSILFEKVEKVLAKGEQVILFQNRRGYAPYVSCDECGWVPECSRCSVSLTYHMYRSELKCHYCGHIEPMPRTCVKCGSTKVQWVGAGTQKIEEQTRLFFPDARIARMDLDTTRRKNSYQEIINDFESGDVDILIGTQMVTKGLDFGKVSLVGVLNPDQMLFFPDFRSHEKAFQMLVQVSGRAGRVDEGEVVIQTANPKIPLMGKISRHDYWSFYNKEIEERRIYHYPPFTRLIKITLKATDKENCYHGAKLLWNQLVKKLGATRVLDPHEPIVNKIRDWFLYDIIIKMERDSVNPSKVKNILREEMAQLSSDHQFKKIRTAIDVDPL